MDYYTALYYQAYTEGYLYAQGNSNPISSGSNANSPGFNLAAVVTTQGSASALTNYTLNGNHLIGTLYQNQSWNGVICGNFYRWNDVFGYVWNGYSNYGSSATIYATYSPACLSSPYINFGTTATSVQTPSFTLSITNPKVNGNVAGTTKNALLGAPVSLSATASPSGVGSGSYSWVLQGQQGTDYDILSGATNSPTLTVRWRKIGSYLATVNYSGTGVNLSSNLTVNAVLPSLSNFSGTIASNVLNTGSHCSGIPSEYTFTLGCYLENGPLTGMVFSATAQIPTNVSYVSDNTLAGVKFKQAITVYARELIAGRLQCTTSRIDPNDYATGWGLDTADPLITGYQFTNGPQYFFNGTSVTMTQFDPPGTALQVGGLIPYEVDAIEEDNWFEDYVFYFVGSSAASPAFEYPQPLRLTNSSNPIDRLAWRFGGSVVWDGSQPASYRQLSSATTPAGPIGATGSSGPKPLARLINSDDPPAVLCPGAPNTTNDIDDSGIFINSLYHDLYDRAPDDAGLNFWRHEITKCGLDTVCIYGNRTSQYGMRLVIAKAFFYYWDEFLQHYPHASDLANPPGSPNFNPSTWNPAYIRALYICFLRRDPLSPPVDSGHQFWTNELNTYGNYDAIFDAFITSTEYRQRFGAADPHW